MKKIFLFSIISLLVLTVKAQESLEEQIQQISPITPNAAALGKFGNTPVSLYTGIPNIQVPIYEIRVKDFSLPISLNYHAGGVKVDDVASWVGMGWSLNAGGMITRQQRGVEDYRMINEKGSYYHYIDAIQNSASTEAQKNAAAYNLQDYRYDTESDIFSLNTATLSHKFFMDVDANIYGMPARKLEIIPESNIYASQNRTYFGRWKVKDERGIEYIFGKTLDDSKEEVEITQSNQVCGASTDNPKTISSWYLNEIILPTGESITFSYEYFSFCVENPVSVTHVVQGNRTISSNSSTSYIKALRIKEISFPSGKVEFVPGDLRRDFAGTNTLEEIKIFAKHSGSYDLVKSFALETNNPNNNTTSDDEGFRLALLSVTENDKFGNALEPYVFDYKNQVTAPEGFGLPARKSAAQDIWGFNNGQTSNTGLMPNYLLKNENGEVIGDVSGANRSVDSDQAQAGILTKITYPTKGSTKFYYESNIAKGATDPSDPNSVNPLINLLNMDVRSTQNKYNGTWLQNTNGSDVKYGDSFEIFHESGVDVTVESHIMYHDYDNECIKTTPISGGASFWECMDIILEKKNASGVFVNFNNTVYFDRAYRLFPGEYRVKLVWDDSSQIGSYGYANLTWSDLENAPSFVVNENTEMVVGGLRISKIIDYDSETDTELIRNYNYDYDATDLPLTGSSGYIQNTPLHEYLMTDDYRYPDNTICVLCNHITSFSNSAILQTGGGFVGYEKVTVSRGFGEGGNTISTFTTPKDYIDRNINNSLEWPFNGTTSLEWRRGLNTKFIENKFSSGQYEPVRTTDNLYTFNDNILDVNYKNLTNIKVNKRINGLVQGFSNITISYGGVYRVYNTIGESFFNNTSTTTLHNSTGDISDTTNYYYDNPVHLQPTRIEAINSKGENSITQMFYADDVVDSGSLGLPNLTTAEKNAIDRLKQADLHQIAAPVQTETTVLNGSTVLSKTTQRTNYQDWGNNIVLPDSIQTLKGDYSTANKMQDRITFYSYDSYGNPTELSKANGPVISYIWGHNGQYPIAKIENVTYSQIATALDISETALKAYDHTNLGAIDGLRSSLPAAMVSTYTYNPLIGVTSMTDPSAYTISYEYDSFNRLKAVRDEQGKQLTDYTYHYKNQ